MSITLGFLLWFVSPASISMVEPWKREATFNYYYLFGTGVLCESLGAWSPFYWYYGVVVGQLIYVMNYGFEESGFLKQIGLEELFYPALIFIIAALSLNTLAGGFTSMGLKWVIRKVK